MIQVQQLRKTAGVLVLAAVFAGCGEGTDETTEASPPDELPATAAGLDPAAVEASVEEFLASDEYARNLSPNVDCGDQPGETQECTVTGDKGLEGAISAIPSPGFQYTGQLDGPDGPSSLGGSSSEGSATNPASVEARLNEVLAEEAGAPEAECPDAAGGDALECSVTGDDISGTLTVTPIGGFEWEGQIATPDGPRAIAGNELP